MQRFPLHGHLDLQQALIWSTSVTPPCIPHLLSYPCILISHTFIIFICVLVFRGHLLLSFSDGMLALLYAYISGLFLIMRAILVLCIGS